jgi:hypothetical protein
MTRDERHVLDDLSALASDPQGRRLLQLALRGIQESGRGLTYGCWVKHDGGVSGCLFQHAYWQGVEEGVFQPKDEVKPDIKEFVGEEDFALVMSSIRAFDALGKRQFTRWRLGPYWIPRRTLDEQRWRATVERLLIDALSRGGEAGVREELAPPRPELGARA